MTHRKSIVAVVFVAILLSCNIGTMGLSSKQEDFDDFAAGTKANATTSNIGVSLNLNNTTTPDWIQTTDGLPGTRFDNGFVYDPVNKVSVLFGGGSDNLTWTYDAATNAWKNMRPADAPGARMAHMAYDTKNGVMVEYGGYNSGGSGTFYNDTWTYNVTTNTWTDKKPSTNPLAMYGCHVAYDEGSGAIVMYGGEDSSYRVYNETWHYYVANNTWTNVTGTTTGTPPKQDYGFGLAYDEANKLIQMYTTNGQTWSYNVSNSTWTNMAPSGSTPGTRQRFGYCYDKDDKVMILHGAWAIFATVANDTWEYNYTNNTWTQYFPTNTPPLHGVGQMVYEPTLRTVLCFGGFIPQGPVGYYVSDMWWYNISQNNWTQKFPPFPGGMRYVQMMTYDPVNKVTVLFGGRCLSPAEIYNDTWIYDYGTRTWTNVTPTVSPPPRSGGAFAYEPVNRTIVLFGGYNPLNATYFNDTWQLNVTTMLWTNITSGTEPSPRYNLLSGMAYDPNRAQFMLFGGYGTGSVYLSDTWTYSVANNTWTPMNPTTAPSARYQNGIVYDTANKVFVIFGGYTGSVRLADTWQYYISNNTWINMAPARAPTARNGFSMEFSSKDNVTYLWGGTTGTTQNDSWVYNASMNLWWQLPTGNAPAPSTAKSIAYDRLWNAFVLFGRTADTWTVNISAKFYTTGDYTSNAVDAVGQAYFGNLSWNGTVPANTNLRFQFRTANTSGALTAASFLGPDGTTGTYYTASPATLNSVHNNYRWFQYKAYFATSNPLVTSYIKDTVVYYNLRQSVSITSPSGGQNWTGTQSITWTASDPDGDTLTFDVWRINQSSGQRFLLAGALPGGTTSWNWDTTTSPNGTYKIEIVANDTNPSIPITGINSTSGNFDIFHTSRPIVTLASPANISSTYRNWMNLTWIGTDPYGDPLTYYVFLSTGAINPASPGTPVATVTTQWYNATSLVNGTYNWTVVANDGYENSTCPSPWKFTVNVNTFPTVTLVSPSNGATIYRNWANLTWTASDGEGDTMTYSIFRSTSPINPANPGTPIGTTANLWFNTTGLTNGTYYWTVRANDTKEDGPVPTARNFIISINTLPTVTLSSPANGATIYRNWANLSWTASDGEGDAMTYSVFRSTSPIDPMNPGTPIGTTSSLWFNTTGMANGTYYWTIRANDGKEDGVAATPRSFIISINTPPSVSLTSPADSATVLLNWVNLTWSGSDGQGDPITYYVFLSTGAINPASPGTPVATTSSPWFNASGLSRRTYNWTVLPFDGKENGTIAAVRMFTCVANSKPTVTLLTPTTSLVVYRNWAVLNWTGTDSDGDPVTYYVFRSTGPINPASPGTPVATTTNIWFNSTGLANGTYNWTVIPNDSYENGTAATVWSFTISINTLPTVTLSGPTNSGTILRSSASLTWTGTDGEGDTMTYYVFRSTSPITPAAPGTPVATVTATTWSSTGMTNGTYYWSVRASDGKENGTVAMPWQFTVSLNNPPTATLISPTNSNTCYRSTVTLTWSGSDAEGDALSYYVLLASGPINLGNPPAPISTVTTGTYVAIGLVNGTYYWTVIPRDGKENGTAPTVWQFTVGLNTPPTATLLSPANGTTVDTSIVSLRWSGSDAESDALSYFVFWSTAIIDPLNAPAPLATVTGTMHNITGVVNGTYYWTIIPKDGKENGTSPAVWKVTVALNSAPTVTLLTPADKATVTTTSINLTWSASDPEGNALTYYVYFSSAPFIATTLPNAPTTTQTATAYNMAALVDGTYYWTIVATDGKLNSTVVAVWTLVVSIPPPNHPPVIKSEPDTTATVDEEWVYEMEISDEDATDMLTIMLVSGPMPVTFHGKTLTWTPTASEVGAQQFSISVSDGKVSVYQDFTVTVSPGANNPPTFTTTPDRLNATVGEEWSYAPVALDQDLGDKVDIVLSSGPAGMEISNGVVIWTPRKNQVGTFEVVIQATDGKTPMVQRFNITVSPATVVNTAPAITAIGNKIMVAGTTLSVQVVATDAERDVLSFNLISPPQGLAIDSTGLITWKPTDAQTGDYMIRFSVSDGKLSTPSSFNVTVKETTKGGKTGTTSGFPWWIIILAVVIVAAAVGAGLAMRKKKGKEPQMAPAAGGAPAVSPTPPPSQMPPTQGTASPVIQPYQAPAPYPAYDPNAAYYAAVGAGAVVAGDAALGTSAAAYEAQAPAEAPQYADQGVTAMLVAEVPGASMSAGSETAAGEIHSEDTAGDALNDVSMVVESAKTQGKDTFLAESLLKLGRIHFSNNNYQEAARFADEARVAL